MYHLSDELVLDFDGFGTYSCLPTVLLFILKAHSVNENPLYIYNWDIDYIKEADYLSGSVDDRSLYALLEGQYGADITMHTYEELKENELYILCMSLFDLSYSEYYMKDNFPHVLVIRKTAHGKIEAWDPVFKRMTIISEQECYNYWVRERHSLVCVRLKLPEKIDKSSVKPFLSQQNYVEKYERAFGMVDQILEVCKSPSEETDFLFSRYFGMIHSIYAAREKYFLAIGTSENEHRVNILSGWRNVEKALMRAKLTLQDKAVLRAFRTIFDLELDYMRKVAASGQGSSCGGSVNGGRSYLKP